MSTQKSTEQAAAKPRTTRTGTDSRKALKALQEELQNLKEDLVQLKQSTTGEIEGFQQKQESLIADKKAAGDEMLQSIKADADKILLEFHTQLEQMLDSADQTLKKAVSEFREKVAAQAIGNGGAPKVPEAQPKAEKPTPKAKAKTKTANKPAPKAKEPVKASKKATEAPQASEQETVLSARELRQREIARLKEETARKLAQYRKDRLTQKK